MQDTKKNKTIYTCQTIQKSFRRVIYCVPLISLYLAPYKLTFTMGKGDKRSRKGKIWKGSYGKSRKRKKKNAGAFKATPAKKATVKAEGVEVKAKKAPAKKAAPKKKAEAKEETPGEE